MQLSPISLAITRLGGVRFSPAALFPSGTAGAWYDPSDSTTIFEDTAGTTPSPTPGAGALSVVGKMLDKSGNGNHAIAYNTTTARPELSARVNLLTYSEQFNNAVWNKFNTTVTANATTAPDGTLTADKLVEAAVTDAHSTYYMLSPAGLSFTFSFYAKAAERTWVKTRGFAADCYFDLANGVLGSVAGGVTASITAVGNGWYRCSVTASTGLSNVQIGVTTGNGVDSYLGIAGNGIFIWGADLRPANIGTSVPAYQRIADQYTYDSSGFPRYLAFNGTASGMYTPANLNLSGTDKATVFAGVRKNADVSIITEFSANAGANNGAFLLATGGWAAENGTYVRQSRGTFTAFAQPATNSYPSPRSDVLTGTSDIVGDSVVLRINGSQVATSATDQGTGNYGTYPLYIGSRNNAGTWLNGYLYSLIVVGAASTAAQISSTESWINVKEGGVY